LLGRTEEFDHPRNQSHVTPPPITGRLRTIDRASILENIEMMREEIRCDAQPIGDFLRRTIAHAQVVGNRQAGRLAQSGMKTSPGFQVYRPHIFTQSLLSDFGKPRSANFR
jgi:hypothetical protein